jgi:hypothetical protein
VAFAPYQRCTWRLSREVSSSKKIGSRRTYHSEEAYREDKASVACKVQAYMPLGGREAPFRASYAGRASVSSQGPNEHLDIPGAGTRKEDKRTHIHEQLRLELQNPLRMTGVE